MSKSDHTSKDIVRGGGNEVARKDETPAGPVVDMQDIQPMISSFQEHLAAEQASHQSRIRGLVAGFVIALAILVALPVYFVQRLLREHHAFLERQRVAQDANTQSLDQALREMAAASRELRVALKEVPATPSPGPQTPVVAVVATQTNAVKAARPVPVDPPKAKEPPPKRSEKVVETTEVATTATVVAVTAPVVTNAPVVTPTPPVTPKDPAPVEPAATNVIEVKAPTAEAGKDLENLLQQIEQSIAEKQKLLDARRPVPPGKP